MNKHTLPSLRTRIDELTTTIEAHKKILCALESSRSDARRELNAIMDPMARLPLEIASDILLRAMPSAVPHPSPGPLLFLAVSHLWQNIALSTPSLWASLRLRSVSRGTPFAQGCETWISRARTLPLSVSVRGSLKDRPICELIKQKAGQIRELRVYPLRAVDLERLIAPFRVLTSLTIGAFKPRSHFRRADEFVAMLRAAPVLEVLTLKGIDFREDIHGEGVHAEALTHASLRALSLSKSDNSVDTTSAIVLQYLTLPALGGLFVSTLDISHTDFIAFLTRSSPPLLVLRLNLPGVDDDVDEWSADVVIKYFQLIPGLIDLDVWADEDADEDDEDPFAAFLQVLASAPDFLPNVQDLTLRTSSLDAQERRNLLRGLTMRRASRHSPLKSCRILFWPGDPADVDDILPSLRQLVEDGLRIHIGHEGQNLI
ncbi:hypothetical protein C8R46DRAFT_366970 [Mycena filopes]|nr:hypothetical protein C8R46DRAFT_366970 [Mycena filopes]